MNKGANGKSGAEGAASPTENVSRRNFLKVSAAGAGLAAAAAGAANQASAADVPDLDIPSIRIPDDIVESFR